MAERAGDHALEELVRLKCGLGEVWVQRFVTAKKIRRKHHAAFHADFNARVVTFFKAKLSGS